MRPCRGADARSLRQRNAAWSRGCLARPHRRGGTCAWWDTLRNGELLDAAEADGFDVFVTTDRNIPYQQNLSGRQIAVVVLGSGRWLLIKQRLAEIAAAVVAAPRGGYIEVDIPPG